MNLGAAVLVAYLVNMTKEDQTWCTHYNNHSTLAHWDKVYKIIVLSYVLDWANESTADRIDSIYKADVLLALGWYKELIAELFTGEHLQIRARLLVCKE